MRTVLFSYNHASNSAKVLAESLGIKRLKHAGSKFVGKKDDQLINWGCGNRLWDAPENIFPGEVLNKHTQVNLCSNKQKFFQYVSRQDPEVVLVPWTVSIDEAVKWCQDGEVVVAREVLQGHSGEGIKIFDQGLDFVHAPLYTKYVPKKAEFRVHIVRGEIIDVQQKIRDPNQEPVDWRVRSHQNGFIFARNDIEPNEAILEEAKRAMTAIGLDFGGVDVIWNDKHQKAYVLEINSACGLEGATVEKYATAFKKHFNV